MKRIHLDKELLEELYINQGLTLKEVREKLRVSNGLLRSHIAKYNIKVRKTIKPSKRIIQSLYIDQNKTAEEVINLLDISKGLFYECLKEYNIQKDYNQVKANISKANREAYSTGIPQKKLSAAYKTGIPQQKAKETCLKKYGVDSTNKVPEIRAKISETTKQTYSSGEAISKRDKTCLKKYGVANCSQLPKIKAQISCSVKKAFATGIPQQKAVETRRENNTFNTSGPEEYIYKALIERYEEENVSRQYKSSLYPYPCDFYIKSLDLYIEYQGTWVHGPHPFDPTNKQDLKMVERWKEKDTEYFNYAVKIFTQRDPLKRKTAKDNNLNWIEFFSLEEFTKFIDKE